MNLKFIKSGEKKRMMVDLEEQFGITDLPFLLLETGKQKIRGFTGTMTKEEILELSTIANVELVGLYLLRKEATYRLSLDGAHMLSNELSENIIEINDTQFDDWLHGKNLEIEHASGVYLIKHKNDFIGCAISDGIKLNNYVPRERRIRNS